MKHAVPIKDIVEHGVFAKLKPIYEGWAAAKKYYAETECGKRYFLRIVSANIGYTRVNAAFELQKTLWKAGVQMPKPLALGYCLEGIYVLFEWIDGMPLRSRIPFLSDEELYEVGITLGGNLQIIHSHTLSKRQIAILETTRQRLVRIARDILGAKLSAKVKSILFNTNRFANQYLLPSDIGFLGVDCLSEYLKQQPQIEQAAKRHLWHRDFGAYNMMVADDRLLIFDFPVSRVFYGDPLQEFAHVCIQLSTLDFYTSLIKGFIDGYFLGKDVGEKIWMKVNYFMAKRLANPPTFCTPRYGWQLRRWVKSMVTLLHFTNNMKAIPIFYSMPDKTSDEVKSYNYWSCQDIELLNIYFSSASEEKIQALPCRNYITTDPCSYAGGGTSEKFYENILKLQVNILVENMCITKLEAKNIHMDRHYTKSCVNCPNYMKKEWKTYYRTSRISVDLLSEAGYEKILHLLEFMKRWSLLSPDLSWQVMEENEESIRFLKKAKEIYEA